MLCGHPKPRWSLVALGLLAALAALLNSALAEQLKIPNLPKDIAIKVKELLPGGQVAGNVAKLDDEDQVFKRVAEHDVLRDSEISYASRPNNWFSQSAGASLRQVALLHRHGDRTPVEFRDIDPLKHEPFWRFHGYGQLTNKGKARLYLYGKLMRKRYNQFLGTSVNKERRISRASGSLRCIESAQTFLSSFLALNEPGSFDSASLVWNRSDELAHLWQPASVRSVPPSLDGMLAEGAECKALDEEYEKTIESLDEVKNLNERFAEESKILRETIGYITDYHFQWFWADSQIDVQKTYFPDKFSKRVVAAYKRIREASSIAFAASHKTTKAKRLRSGLLINDIVQNMEQLRDQTSNATKAHTARKLLHYVGHDVTVVALLSMLENENSNTPRPDYAASIVMELHQTPDAKSEWFLKFFYLPYVPGEGIELRFARCSDGHPAKLCTLDKFAQLMEPYRLRDWQTWFAECGNTFSRLNPYKMSS